MNKQNIVALAIAALSIMPMSVFAHSAEQHMKNAESPNCEAMKSMDHSKMDPNDPVMMALMQQCSGHDMQ